MKSHAGIEVSREALADFCRRHHILKLSFFGSVLRDDFAAGSDVDVLVEFSPGAQVGLITLPGMEIELSGILGRKVDMNTEGFLSPFFRDEVLREAAPAYELT